MLPRFCTSREYKNDKQCFFRRVLSRVKRTRFVIDFGGDNVTMSLLEKQYKTNDTKSLRRVPLRGRTCFAAAFVRTRRRRMWLRPDGWPTITDARHKSRDARKPGETDDNNILTAKNLWSDEFYCLSRDGRVHSSVRRFRPSPSVYVRARVRADRSRTRAPTTPLYGATRYRFAFFPPLSLRFLRRHSAQTAPSHTRTTLETRTIRHTWYLLDNKYRLSIRVPKFSVLV